jgi:predicted ATPase
MSKIKIKNFGPVKEGFIENDGWMDVKKVTVFIGNQGSGKSTVAKVISTLTWLEKAINRGDIEKGKVSFSMLKKFFNYQKIDNYFSKNTYIEYFGEKYYILCDRTKEFPVVTEVKNKNYIVPKIMYIPSERNFLSTISDAFNVKGLPDNLFTFAEELRKAQKELNGKKIKLPIEGYFYEYDEEENLSYVVGDNYRISLLEASSGLQSFIPLYLVSKSLSFSISKRQKKENNELTVTQSIRFANEIMKIMNSDNLSEKEKSKQTSLIKGRYFNKCFQNIVEEPEQNLFPSSQWEMLKSLLEFNNKNKGNRLIITTHSPYLINYLSISIQAYFLKNQIKTEDLKRRLNNVVPLKSIVNPKDAAIYQLDDINGVIARLPDYKGIPSDNNYLNQSLADGNRLFDSLLEIEEEL